MNDLINPASIGGQQMPSVDARHLHERLGVETNFRDWIKRRIEELNLEIGNDFEVSLKNERNLSGGRPSQEYLLTIRAAMRICVAERTERGDQLRDQLVDYLLASQDRAPVRNQSLDVQIEAKLEALAAKVASLEADAELAKSADDWSKPCEYVDYAYGITLEKFMDHLEICDSRRVIVIDYKELVKILVNEGWLLMIKGQPVTTLKAARLGMMTNMRRAYSNGERLIPALTDKGVEHLTKFFQARHSE